MSDEPYTPDEMMTIAAAREVVNGKVYFVGIGLPSRASVLARALHAPEAVLVYESGAIGTKPDVFPLSIGDGDLAESADTIVSFPEIFAYWLQGGRIDVGFLGAAQVDRFGNLNSTVIGSYAHPKTRLPGAGGAPEIAAHSGEVVVVIRHSTRALVERVDFRTTAGYLGGGDERERLGLRGAGPATLITDLGIMRPAPDTRELMLCSVHEGVRVDQVRAATGWGLRVSESLAVTKRPTAKELSTLREISERTARRIASRAVLEKRAA